ncbi:MAG: homoserine dehydrogenase [Firmicutes bacterium]|nr:homoserine dehydrogenase [Bacillota bacterium]
MECKTKKLALLGFGNAGQAFAKLLMEKHEEIIEKYGFDVVVTAVATNSKGNLVCEDGIDLHKALSDIDEFGRFMDEKNITEADTMKIVSEADYDVLVEMTPLNIFTGQPAISHIETAFSRGKDVITANKGPVAWKFSQLNKTARDNNLKFYYETTVMDGTPVFNLVDKTLMMAKVTEVSGILNSTTNFILEELAKGAEYEDIMSRGRRMGFIEADSAMDIEGYDAAAKITALLNVLMDADITPDMVDRKGIEDITVEDIKAADKRGNVIKLLCKGVRDEKGNVKASVKPEEVPKNHMLASIDSTTSVVSITTDLMKTVSIIEHEPEIEQTAYGVFGDLLRVLSE